MKLFELTEDAILAAPMNEMANFYPQETGLGVVIWFGEVGGQHGPRIKVSNIAGKFAINDNFVISVSRNPQVLTPKSMKLKENQLADIFTKPLLEESFNFIKSALHIIKLP